MIHLSGLWIESSKDSIYLKCNFFYNIINVFTLTFDASLLNKSIYLKSINTDIITSEESREEHNKPLRSDHWVVPQQHYPWPHNWHECELQTQRDEEVMRKKTLNMSLFIYSHLNSYPAQRMIRIDSSVHDLWPNTKINMITLVYSSM